MSFSLSFMTRRAPLRAGDDAVDGLVEGAVVDELRVGAGGEQRGLVEHVREVGAREARRLAGDDLEVDARRRAACPCACTSRIFLRPLRSGASTPIWRSKRPGRSSAGSRMSGRLVAAMRMTFVLGSKPSISTSSWLSVCSRSSWPPPMPAPRWRPTASISSTKMIAGRVLLGLVEQVAHAARADADEHLDEVRAGDRVERHARLARDGAGEQGLAGSGRAVQQHALGDARADGLELRGLLEEVLDLLELLDRLVGAGDVVEGDLRALLRDELRLGLAELHDLVAAALHAREQEPEEEADEAEREQEAEHGESNQFGCGDLVVEAVARAWRVDRLTTSAPRGVT